MEKSHFTESTMRKIKPENIKVGDYFYIESKDKKKRRFVVKKTTNDSGWEWANDKDKK